MNRSFFLQALAVLLIFFLGGGNEAIAYSDEVFIDFKEDPGTLTDTYVVRNYKISINNTNNIWTELTCPTGEPHYIRLGYASAGALQLSRVRSLSCKAGEKITNGLRSVINDFGGEDVWVNTGMSDIWAAYTTGIDGHPEATTRYVHRLCFYATTSSSTSSVSGEPIGCGFTSPVDVSCQITPANIDFSYSALSSKALNGNTMQKNLSVNCTGATDALIYVTTGVDNSDNYNGVITLDSSGKLSSKIKINNAEPSPEGIGVRFNSGVNSLLVSSTLQSIGDISSGTYSGSAVLTINPQ